MTRFGNAVQRIDERRPGVDLPLLSVSQTRGVLRQIELTGRPHRAESLDPYKICREGDIVFNKMSIRTGAMGVAGEDGLVTYHYEVMRPRQNVSSDFINYVMKSDYFRGELVRRERGIGAGGHAGVRTTEVPFSSLRLIDIYLPSLEQQDRISQFLDRETAKIDALIAKQEQLITTLDERRKAVIARCISQGINRDSKLVQTGNPQVAAIPSHWSLKRLRHFAQIESGADYKDLETLEDGFPVYGSGGVFAKASKSMYNGESVLFGRKGTIDRPLYVNGPFWTVDTMYWTRFNQPVNVKFVYYWATTVPFGLFTTSTALPSMTSSDIKNFFVAMPPFSEQIDIVEHLDGAVESIDHLTSAAQKTVETLRERRQALISAAVTGKLEVGV